MKDTSVQSGESPDLLEDLMETSGKIFHRNIAHFQLTQHHNLRAVCAEVGKWREEQLASGQETEERLNWIIAEHMTKVKDATADQLDRYMMVQERELEIRRRAINVFVSNRNNAAA